MEEGLFLPISVLIAGVLSFFSPCIIPLLPVYVGYLSAEAGGIDKTKENKINKRLVYQTLIFVLGLSTSFIILGIGAGAIGSLINSRITNIISGVIVIILGLYHVGLFNIPFLLREKKITIKHSRKGGVIGAYLLGLTFSLGWTPCIGPVLGTVIGLASYKGQVLYGGLLMAVYSVGLAIPFVLISLFAGIFLKHVKKVYKYLPIVRIVGGVLIILMGIMLLTGRLNTLQGLFSGWR